MKAIESVAKADTGSKTERVKIGNVTVPIYFREITKKGVKYPQWRVADYTTGTRRLQSFGDRDKALAHADFVVKALNGGQVAAAELSSAQRASYGRAMELIKDTGTPLEIVAATYANAYKELGANKIPEAVQFYKQHDTANLVRKTVAEAVAELIALKESEKPALSERYIWDLRYRLDRFSKSFQNIEICDVTTANVQSFLDGLKLSKQSYINYRRVINLLFVFSESRHYVARRCNPVTEADSKKAEGSAIGVFTHEEIKRLADACPADFLPSFLLGAFAGIRNAEILRLNWQDINLREKQVHVEKEKVRSRSGRFVPISKNLAAWLTPIMQKDGPIWPHSLDWFHKVQSNVAAAAGVEWKQNALRHSYITYRLALTQNADAVAMECGNSAEMIFKFYHNHKLAKKKLAQKYFAVMPPHNLTNVITLERKAVA